MRILTPLMTFVLGLALLWIGGGSERWVPSVAAADDDSSSSSSSNDHPMRHDRTGIEWEVPFAAARAMAEEENRLLVIKPVAFGTTASGCW